MATVRMDRVNLWAQALRSGKYPQGKGILYDGQRYCPLGVACAVYGHVTGSAKFKRVPTGAGSVWHFLGQTAFMPKVVAQWYGMEWPVLRLRGVGIHYLNDRQKMTFTEMAALVEEEFRL